MKIPIAAIALALGLPATAQEAAPRARQDVDATRAASLRLLDRFDRNGDGRVTKAEWTGAPSAFESLDLDRDGVLDKKDKKLAERKTEDHKQPTYDDVEVTAPLQDAEYLFKRYDKNRDQLISQREAMGARWSALFDIADVNKDSMLDPDEVQAMVREVATRVRQRSMGYLSPDRPFEVPFSVWDKNKDGRLDTGEWIYRKDLFPRIDVDRDGAVTKEEIARYEKSVKGDDFVEKFDLNGDGKVTLAEFAGPADAFRRADRNGDGAVSRADR